MFSKPVSQLTYDDIDNLVNVRQEKEGYYIDYKGEINYPDKAKNELAKDISAFANSSGGYLIMGVDKSGAIKGVSNTIQNRPIDEWINQVLSSNIDPQVYYEDPKVIPIPDNDKVIVVIHVPESTKKPHMTTGFSTYQIRINDSCKTANHSQVRDMFEFSRNRTDEFNQFLQKRNLLNENSKDFGLNKNSLELNSEFTKEIGFPKPIILFSLIPKFPFEEKIKIPFNQFHTWLASNSYGYQPYPSMPLFHTNDYSPMLDGTVFKHTRQNKFSSYFEVLDNGYIESGFSQSLTYAYMNVDGKGPEASLYASHVIFYEMLLLGFAKRFYEYIKYYDEVLLQISFINVSNLRLYGLHDDYKFNYGWNKIINNHHNNFKLNFKFNVRTLTDENCLNIAKQHSEKLCRAFGLEQDYCFKEDKLSIRQMNNFYL